MLRLAAFLIAAFWIGMVFLEPSLLVEAVEQNPLIPLLVAVFGAYGLLGRRAWGDRSRSAPLFRRVLPGERRRRLGWTDWGCLLLLAGGAWFVAHCALFLREHVREEERQWVAATSLSRTAFGALARLEASDGRKLISERPVDAADLDFYLLARHELAVAGRDAAEARSRLRGTLLRGEGEQPQLNLFLERRADLARRALPILDATGRDADELADIVEVVEWRFLRVAEAWPLALSLEERSRLDRMIAERDHWRRRATASEPPLEAEEGRRLSRRLEELAPEIERLRGLAEERVLLDESSRALLESRRSELQSRHRQGILELAFLAEGLTGAERYRWQP